MAANQKFSCNCACHHYSSNTNKPQHNRPTMEAIHQLIQNRQWDQVQDSIRQDASVAMRIDDSPEEDCWVDEARRRWVQRQKQDASDSDDETEKIATDLRHAFALMKLKNQCKTSSTEEDNGNPPMQLRYWVGNGVNNNNNSEASKMRRMTLLHSLCRLEFSSQGNQGDGSEDDDIAMAIQTAEMIISASHNEHQPCCPCQYCPPMFFPAVSKGIEEDEEEEFREREDGVVLHTSALTITDKMGGTPLHELTGSGSHHIELIQALFRGCAPLNVNKSGRSQRPTVYDLLAAPNDHGSTPLHFMSECDQADEGVLRFVLEQCPLFVDSNEEHIHPSMIGDNEGDLPLHYALSNCAPPVCIEILTALGDKRATLVPNSRHQLPIDVLIEYYSENLEDFFEKQNSDSDDSNEESEDDSDEDEESSSSGSHLSEEVITDNNDQLPEKIASVMVAANVNRPIEDNISSAWALLERNNACGDLSPLHSRGKCYLCPGKSVDLVRQGMISEDSSDFWDSDLWKQMIVLIGAAAAAILESSGFTNTNESGSSSAILQSNPLHAAVIATKYGHFPAFALAMASPLDSNYKNEMASTYFLGYLPLHWICGDISLLLDSANSVQKQYQDQQNPSTEQCNELVRFNTIELGITLIQYVLLLWPEAARVPTKDHGELPLHLFLKDKRALWNYLSKKKTAQARDVNGMPFDPLESTSVARVSPDTPRCTPWDEIKSLLSACPEALSTPSMTNHLYPFQQAATASHSLSSDEDSDGDDIDVQKKTRLLSLENTYRLILEDPSVVYTERLKT